MIRIAAIGIVAVVIAIILKKGGEEYSFCISISACAVILLLGLSKLQAILDAMKKIQGYIKINESYIGILIKIIGVTYITELSASLCRDCKFQAISEQIELVGKLTILAIGMPIVLALLETISTFMSK